MYQNTYDQNKYKWVELISCLSFVLNYLKLSGWSISTLWGKSVLPRSSEIKVKNLWIYIKTWVCSSLMNILSLVFVVSHQGWQYYTTMEPSQLSQENLMASWIQEKVQEMLINCAYIMCFLGIVCRSIPVSMHKDLQCDSSWVRNAAYWSAAFSPLKLSFSPSTPMNSHVRVLCLLLSLLLDCCGLAVVCGLLGASHGMHTLSFMAAEVRTLIHKFSKQYTHAFWQQNTFYLCR